jgi:hypothetical protein
MGTRRRIASHELLQAGLGEGQVKKWRLATSKKSIHEFGDAVDSWEGNVAGHGHSKPYGWDVVDVIGGDGEKNARETKSVCVGVEDGDCVAALSRAVGHGTTRNLDVWR